MLRVASSSTVRDLACGAAWGCACGFGSPGPLLPRPRGAAGDAPDQDGSMPERIRQIVLDRENEVRHGEAGCQPARESEQVAQLALASTQHRGFAPKPGREMAGHEPDEHENQ